MSDAERVVIVGLGPVGATIALLLGRAGIPTLVLERAAEVFPHGRAIALDDEALRVLQAAGLHAAQLPEILTDVPVRFRDRHGRSLLEIAPHETLTGHPSLVFFNQPDLERRLRSALQRHASVELLLQHDVERCEQHDDRVEITARDLRTDTTGRFAARWVIACDGASSRIRRDAGIALRGVTFRHRWLVIDSRLQAGRTGASFEFLCDPRRPTVSASLPGGTHRWEFMLLPGENADEIERSRSASALVARHAAREDVELLHHSIYAFHARVADRWQQGRLLLAGDAAHLSPPFAGQGLSAGLRDAHNLAWKIAAVMQQQAAPTLLSSYQAERRPHTVRLIALALALGAIIQVRCRAIAALRDIALRTVLAFPGLRHHVLAGTWKPSSPHRRGFVSSRPRRRRIEGSQLPQPKVRVDGTSQLLDDVLGDRFTLIGWEMDPSAALDASSLETLATLSTILLHATESVEALHPPRSGVVVAADCTGALARWFADAGASLALIRPDRLVYAAFDASEASEVVRELELALGASNPRAHCAPHQRSADDIGAARPGHGSAGPAEQTRTATPEELTS